jgi:KDO2-lipid IV(A) lauroyltransferase
MMIDQVPSYERAGVKTEFLGRIVLVDRGPATLAARERVPLVVAAARREPGGDHVLHVLDVLETPERPGRAWIDAATIAATRALDRFVRAHPSQWLWMHRRWRMPRVAERARPSMLAVP